MPLSILLALPVATTAATAVFAPPLLGMATLLALLWTVGLLLTDLRRRSDAR